MWADHICLLMTLELFPLLVTVVKNPLGEIKEVNNSCLTDPNPLGDWLPAASPHLTIQECISVSLHRLAFSSHSPLPQDTEPQLSSCSTGSSGGNGGWGGEWPWLLLYTGTAPPGPYPGLLHLPMPSLPLRPTVHSAEVWPDEVLPSAAHSRSPWDPAIPPQANLHLKT